MMPKPSFKTALSAFAASVFLAVAVVVVGCDKRDEVYVAEGHAYAKDPAFQAAMKERQSETSRLVKRRIALDKRREELLAESGGDRAKAAKMPAWRELEDESREVAKAFESNRQATARIVRDRVRRATEDSARVKRGEAKAIRVLSEGEKK